MPSMAVFSTTALLGLGMVLMWMANRVDRGGKMFSVTFDGKIDRDLRSDSIDWYNETWAKIVAPLQEAMAAAATAFLPGSSSDGDYWKAACNHRYGSGSWSEARRTCDPDPYKRGY